jgi:hypothetical protein
VEAFSQSHGDHDHPQFFTTMDNFFLDKSLQLPFNSGILYEIPRLLFVVLQALSPHHHAKTLALVYSEVSV